MATEYIAVVKKWCTGGSVIGKDAFHWEVSGVGRQVSDNRSQPQMSRLNAWNCGAAVNALVVKRIPET
jgi:hypothetical protein